MYVRGECSYNIILLYMIIIHEVGSIVVELVDGTITC